MYIEKWILVVLLALNSACTSSTPQTSTSQEGEEYTAPNLAPSSKTTFNPEQFLGSWKIIDVQDNSSQPYDHSMDNIICKLERYQDTQETFVFYLFTGNDLILSPKDENTLIGENANMLVSFDKETEHLTLSIPGKSSWIFRRLK